VRRRSARADRLVAPRDELARPVRAGVLVERALARATSDAHERSVIEVDRRERLLG
jgi:hypothetical protein